MKRFIFVLILATLVNPLQASAQDHEVVAGTTVGGGLDDLIIEGTPDEHGLIWMIREPSREFESWFVWVYNASQSPVYDVRASLEIEIEGQWYLPNISASNRLMYPTRIDPGGIGFLEFGRVMANPTPWDDSRIEVDTVESQHTLGVVPVDVSLTGKRGKYSVTFTNQNEGAVSKVTLVLACIENGEISVIDTEQSDLIRLKSEDTETIQFQSDATCTAKDRIFTAIAND